MDDVPALLALPPSYSRDGATLNWTPYKFQRVPALSALIFHAWVCCVLFHPPPPPDVTSLTGTPPSDVSVHVSPPPLEASIDLLRDSDG